MSALGRVVWRDGMHLSQHHFQAQNRYFEELIHFVATSLYPESHGLVGCQFDAEALRNDTVALIHARGVMPDGLVFHFPHDPAPAPRQIRDLFSPTQDAHLVLLAIPPFLEGRANLAADGEPADSHRFIPESTSAIDEGTGTDTRPVRVARKNFSLLLDAEDTSRLTTLPVARVKRDGTGHFVYDDQFVPPCLNIGASPALMTLLAGWIEMLTARSEALAPQLGGDDEGDVANRWLAHAIHASLGPLLHLQRLRHAHPAELFGELLRLAGALCTFSMHTHPRDLPLYDHSRASESFAAIDLRIREMLNVVAPSSAVRIPIRPVADSFFGAVVDDSRCFGQAQWFLGVRSSLPAAELAGSVPRLVNICSAKHIGRLVREAIPGLPVKHQISPPPAISPRQGTEYFAIPRTGPCWASIVESREVGIYAPAAIGDVELELIISLDG